MRSMISPAQRTPAITAMTLFLKSKSRREAARVPVQAPVPGRGMPTKRNRAKYRLSPVESWSFLPAFSPFLRQKLQNFLRVF